MAKRKKSRFLRIGYTQYSKLGLRRKNKQKYRKGKGGENKMRLKMKGHLRNVSIGFRSEEKTRGFVNGFEPVLIHNLEQLKKIQKNEIGIVAKMGNKKKIEIANYALKNNIRFLNLNSKKFLSNIEEELKKKKEGKQGKKIEKEKKAKEAEKKDKASSDLNKSEDLKNAAEAEIKENMEEAKQWTWEIRKN